MPTVHIIFDAHVRPVKTSVGDFLFFWNASHSLSALREAQCFCLSSQCATHMTSLRSEFAALMYDLAFVHMKGAPLQDHLKAGDRLSMWWCSLLFEKHPHLLPPLENIFKLRMLERLLRHVPWTHMCVYGEASKKDTAISGILEDFCHTHGKDFQRKEANKKDAGTLSWQWPSHIIRRLYKALPFVCQGIIRFAHWLWTVRRLVPPVLSPVVSPEHETRAKDDVSMVAYFPHPHATAQETFLSPYWQSLQNMLRGTKTVRMHWLFVRIHTKHTSLRSAVRLCQQYTRQRKDGASFHFMESFLDVSRICRAMCRFMRLFYISARLEKHVAPHCRFEKAHKSMHIWPLLRPSWRESFQGWRCLERCLQREAMLSYAVWAHSHAWTLFPWENCPWERMLVDAVRHEQKKNGGRAHGRVYAAQHSTVRAADFRYFDDPRIFSNAHISFIPDKILTNGHHAHAQLEAAGVPKSLLQTVEALRYLHLATIARYSLPKKPVLRRLLVMTGFFMEEVDVHMRILDDFARYAPQDIRICIKAHPYCLPHMRLYPHARDRAAMLQTSLSCILSEAAHTRGALTLVWTSNSTTAAVEAAVVGLPLVVHAPQTSFDMCPLQNFAQKDTHTQLTYVSTWQEVAHALLHPHVICVSEDFFCLPAQQGDVLERWGEILGKH